MAYDSKRFSLLSGGQTGAGMIAKYDGTGSGAEGGDNLAAVKGNGFLSGTEAIDAVRKAMDGRSTGAGLPIILAASDALEMDVAFLTGGQVRMRGGGFNMS